MKKLTLTVALCSVCCIAFAQHNFKPIRCIGQYSKYSNGVTQSDRMDENININTKDSVVTISPSYGQARSFKLIDMADEKTLVYEDKRTLKYFQFHGRDEKGKTWLIQLQRQTQPKTKDMMTLVVSDQAGEFTNYSCEFQKEI